MFLRCLVQQSVVRIPGFLIAGLATLAWAQPQPLVELRFNENGGATTANTGTSAGSYGSASLTATRPSWSTTVAPSGGASCLDFGTATTARYAVSLPSSGTFTALNGMRSFTISGWVNCRSNTEGGGGNRIIGMCSGWNNGGIDLVFKSDGSLLLMVNTWDDGSPARSTAGKVTVNSSAPVSNWVFFAVTYDGTITSNNVNFYFGNQATQAALDATRSYNKGTLTATTTNLAVGNFATQSSGAGSDRMFRGLIDEIRIFGSSTGSTGALSLNDVRVVQNMGSAVPPAITTQPADQSVAEFQAVTFSVVATGTPAPTYQWRRNGVDLSGATSSTYSFTASLADNGAWYSVVVNNASGSVTSRDALLSVSPVAPSIILQPASRTALEGSSTTFSVRATGSRPLSFQWQRGGAGIPGATDSNYTLAPVPYSDNGLQFRCVVSNGGGSVTSSAAALTVTALPPVITQQPTNQTAVDGQTATFAVAATSSAPMGYQWRKNGTAVGTNSPTYTTAPVTMADNAAQIQVSITNSGGAATSNTVTLTVSPVPVAITQQPRDTTVADGSPALFRVVATGSAPLSYQWRRNSAAILGATAATCNLSSVTFADNGALYDCQVTNPAGTVTSTAARLTVTAVPPSVLQHPASRTAVEGSSTTFTVRATGTRPLRFQWLRNGSDIAAATDSNYALDPVPYTDNGALFSCRVSNDAGSQTSSAATLTVTPRPPVITTQPVAQSVIDGNQAAFTIAATSSVPVTYQWRRNSSNIAGANLATYVTPATTMADNGAQFDCIVSNSGGSATSNTAQLTVQPRAPTISMQPQPQTVVDGGTATFSVTAAGTPPLTYQWRRQGEAIPGATQATCTISPVVYARDNASQFDCVVSNAAGFTTSAQAQLTVTPVSPIIALQPSDQTVVVGSTATFEVRATGTATLTYQWRRDGLNIPGATGAVYTTPPTQLLDNNMPFDCVVGNSWGVISSRTATLFVTEAPRAPSIITQPVSQTVNDGAPVSITVAAGGTMPLTYAWTKNGAAYGANSPAVTIAAAVLDDAGSYQVTVSNAQGSVVSTPAILTVIPGSGTLNSQMLSISGELYGSDGNPVGYPDPDTVDATVRLMNHATAGAAVYVETFRKADGQGVIVDYGVFVARLGQGTSGQDLTAVLSANPHLWVEITIEGATPDVLLPRTPLTASPYTLKAPTLR